MHTEEAVVATQPESVLSRACRKALSAYWWRRIGLFRAMHRTRPASLRTCRRIQAHAEKRLGNPSAMTHSWRSPRGGILFNQDADLSRMLQSVPLDGFSLHFEALEWLAKFLEAARPRVVLEFGSGYSTLLQCAVLERIHGPVGFRLLSFEQDVRFLEKTAELMKARPGRTSCRLAHAPLVPGAVAGRATSFYNLAGEAQEHLRWLGKAEFVFIDGPFAKGPCRYATLPAVRGFLAPGASFAMDDGLRGKELLVGSLWEEEGVQVEGVLTMGRGIVVGSVPQGRTKVGVSKPTGAPLITIPNPADRL